MEHLSDDVGELVELVELVEFWTLLDEDRALLEGRRGATTLGFALLLKHYSRHGRFPRSAAELAPNLPRRARSRAGHQPVPRQ